MPRSCVRRPPTPTRTRHRFPELAHRAMGMPRRRVHLRAMGRLRRSHLPGATFHLTTRLHQREELFEPELRTAIVRFLRQQLAISDVELFAYAVMPNHLHLVLRQGSDPLSRFMQPMLRRIALLVHRRHACEGYVFERRYRDLPCSDPDHLRNSIAYAHLNPVRAGLCEEPGRYLWTSHGDWVGGPTAAPGAVHPTTLDRALQLFASGPVRTHEQLVADYQAFVSWRRAYDLWRAEIDSGKEAMCSPPPPPVGQGDRHWQLHLTAGRPGFPGSDVSGESVPGDVGPSRPDLSTIARGVIDAVGPGLDPAIVRSRWGGPSYVRARHTIIRRASALAFRNVEIAAFLRISANAVSDVITSERKRLILART